MDKNFQKIFAAICESAEVTAEQAMELDHQQNNADGEKAAMKMRDDFAALRDKLVSEECVLTKEEYVELTVATYIASNQIQNRISELRKALKGYNEKILPKLNRILDETKNDEEAKKLADEILIFEDNE